MNRDIYFQVSLPLPSGDKDQVADVAKVFVDALLRLNKRLSFCPFFNKGFLSYALLQEGTLSVQFGLVSWWNSVRLEDWDFPLELVFSSNKGPAFRCGPLFLFDLQSLPKFGVEVGFLRNQQEDLLRLIFSCLPPNTGTWYLTNEGQEKLRAFCDLDNVPFPPECNISLGG